VRMDLETTTNEVNIFYEQFVHAPQGSDAVEQGLTNFLKHQSADQKIAWVTSGGTIIPLEKNMVRFIDNFSGGNRGAASTEYFLEHGYSVIFLHRKRSIMPFHRHFLRDNEHVLDRIKLNEDGELIVEHASDLKEWVSKYHKSIADNRVFYVPFITIYDYFFWMKVIAHAINPFGKRVLFYSAAAVSDFYIKNQAEHKIQSTNKGLDVSLSQVPKLIPLMKPLWTPGCMVITFKLETDASILDSKVDIHIGYGVDMVIGNILGKHQNEVVLFQRDHEKFRIIRTPEEQKQQVDIEKALIAEISKRHTAFSQ